MLLLVLPGRAIDLNARLIPYIDRTGAFQPKNAAPYLDRNRTLQMPTIGYVVELP